MFIMAPLIKKKHEKGSNNIRTFTLEQKYTFKITNKIK